MQDSTDGSLVTSAGLLPSCSPAVLSSALTQPSSLLPPSQHNRLKSINSSIQDKYRVNIWGCEAFKGSQYLIFIIFKHSPPPPAPSLPPLVIFYEMQRGREERENIGSQSGLSMLTWKIILKLQLRDCSYAENLSIHNNHSLPKPFNHSNFSQRSSSSGKHLKIVNEEEIKRLFVLKTRIGG